ncbi:NAD(P)-binding protein [Sistotremastrum niveocremeum HHB9708]|uniref:NAD(P)-binding protein n=1 Tax=Sistotremastrum niveocremeum HHB9708 TaxID=1314777 RepID=A0A164W2U2_9AGAM|nr:NAD(P)-binding protein [Sistotremastrum niveocremeum HHB9708]
MPALSQGHILVTGAAGFIGTWITKTLLDNNYRVRGTVRLDSEGLYLQDLFQSFQDSFTYAIVEDVVIPGCFDDLLDGIDGVVHAASPVAVADDPQELIRPAVQGTLGILQAAFKHGPSVKRIVITSSVGSITGDPPPSDSETQFLTENDWNTVSVPEVEKKGAQAAQNHKYRASKTLAEKAAWNFVKENQVNFDIITIHPVMVLGPILQPCAAPENLNLSVSEFWQTIQHPPNGRTDAELVKYRSNFVDVRDVAAAHLEALKRAEAGGERFIVGNGPYAWQDVLDALSSFPNIPRGQPFGGKGITPPTIHDSSKSKKVLGLKYRPLEESANDTFLSFLNRGWIQG